MTLEYVVRPERKYPKKVTEKVCLGYFANRLIGDETFAERNAEIRRRYESGSTPKELAEEFQLDRQWIAKICGCSLKITTRYERNRNGSYHKEVQREGSDGGRIQGDDSR